LLHAADPLGIDQLSRHLSISRNATYQHVTALERDGLVAKAEIAATKGRPGQTYQLTEAGRATFPRHYALFAHLLIGVIKARLGAEDLKACLTDLGQSLAAQFAGQVSDLDPARQIEDVAAILLELGYEAKTTASKAMEAEIVAHNCVFHDLARDHPEVCALDLALMSTLLGRQIDHVECMVRGGSCCRFRAGRPLDDKGPAGAEASEPSPQ
jgi:DeoR family suf operon transcriptional repressor